MSLPQKKNTTFALAREETGGVFFFFFWINNGGGETLWRFGGGGGIHKKMGNDTGKSTCHFPLLVAEKAMQRMEWGGEHESIYFFFINIFLGSVRLYI